MKTRAEVFRFLQKTKHMAALKRKHSDRYLNLAKKVVLNRRRVKYFKRKAVECYEEYKKCCAFQTAFEIILYSE